VYYEQGHIHGAVAEYKDRRAAGPRQRRGACGVRARAARRQPAERGHPRSPRPRWRSPRVAQYTRIAGLAYSFGLDASVLPGQDARAAGASSVRPRHSTRNTRWPARAGPARLRHQARRGAAWEGVQRPPAQARSPAVSTLFAEPAKAPEQPLRPHSIAQSVLYDSDGWDRSSAGPHVSEIGGRSPGTPTSQNCSIDHRVSTDNGGVHAIRASTQRRTARVDGDHSESQNSDLLAYAGFSPARTTNHCRGRYQPKLGSEFPTYLGTTAYGPTSVPTQSSGNLATIQQDSDFWEPGDYLWLA